MQSATFHRSELQVYKQKERVSKLEELSSTVRILKDSNPKFFSRRDWNSSSRTSGGNLLVEALNQAARESRVETLDLELELFRSIWLPAGDPAILKHQRHTSNWCSTLLDKAPLPKHSAKHLNVQWTLLTAEVQWFCIKRTLLKFEFKGSVSRWCATLRRETCTTGELTKISTSVSF